ncbi:MAG: N-acetyltransferase [Peptococcaceae bacterium]
MKITELQQKHKELLKNFSCGNAVIDNFLKSKDAYNNSIGKTYILLSEDESVIIGYYTISTGSVDYLEDHLRIRDAGSIHINYFAIDESFQKNVIFEDDGAKTYVSDYLLDDCFKRIEKLRDTSVGFSYITLDSTLEGIWLYERNGFYRINSEDNIVFSSYKHEMDSIPMYLFLDEE